MSAVSSSPALSVWLIFGLLLTPPPCMVQLCLLSRPMFLLLKHPLHPPVPSEYFKQLWNPRRRNLDAVGMDSNSGQLVRPSSGWSSRYSLTTWSCNIGEGSYVTSYRVAVAVLSQDGVQLRLHSQSLLVCPGRSRRAENSGGAKKSQREGEKHLVLSKYCTVPLFFISANLIKHRAACRTKYNSDRGVRLLA